MSLFDRTIIGRYDLKNRIVMAPMNRNRATINGVPTPLMATYFAQRASAGLIITDATQVSPMSVSSGNCPCLYSKAHGDGWKAVTRAVHEAGGHIFVQLRHVGRLAHFSRLPGAASAVAPSAIAAPGQTMSATGWVPNASPRALEAHDITSVIGEFAQAAQLAMEAGFDGVEIHAANGYLIEQFLCSGSNQRGDLYGGSIANRCRFLIEIAEVLVNICGAERVGVRLSPYAPLSEMHDSDPAALFLHAARELGRLRLGYLHIVEGAIDRAKGNPILAPRLREAFGGPLIVNEGYTFSSSEDAIARGYADLVSFGMAFVANPDLPERFRLNAPLNIPVGDRYYGGPILGYTDHSNDAYGYTDYPCLTDTVALQDT